jgi:hypothetical protein
LRRRGSAVANGSFCVRADFVHEQRKTSLVAANHNKAGTYPDDDKYNNQKSKL